jgi:hypothetical protein
MTKITSLGQVADHVLTWPEHQPRVARRVGAPKGQAPHGTNIAAARQKVEDEMRRAGAAGHVVSMNPTHRFGSPDPAVAVWWNHRQKVSGKLELRVMACDKWMEPAHNLYAIGLSLDLLRRLDRYGAYTAEQAMEGAKAPALPPPAGMETEWRTVLAIEPGIDALKPRDLLAIAETRYRDRMALIGEHGDVDKKKTLNAAIAKAREELKAPQPA